VSAIPATPAAITPEWMTAVLGAPVSQVRTSAVGGGSGFVGVVVRLHLEHDGHAPDSVVAKLASTNPQALEYVRNYGLYRAEHGFYTKARDRASVRTPCCYYSALSDDGMSVVLLLEDLDQLRLGDQVAGASAEDAERVVRAVARLHAAWWGGAELERFAWLPAVDSELNQARAQHAAHAWPAFLDRYGSAVSASSLGVAERVPIGLKPLLDSWAARGPITYAHFDVRLDNVMYDDSVAGPEGVWLLDWQMSQRSLGASDLAWFLSWSLTAETRRQYHDTLLDAYLDELVDHGVAGYTRSQLERDVRECIALVVAMAIVGGATAPTPDARSRAVIDALVERVFATVDDLDVGECL
jgi:hypothetical protein